MPGDLNRRQNIVGQPAQRGELPHHEDRDRQAAFDERHSPGIIFSAGRLVGASGQDLAARAGPACATMSIAARNAPGGGATRPLTQASISSAEAPSALASRAALPSVSIARRNVLVYGSSAIMAPRENRR